MSSIVADVIEKALDDNSSEGIDSTTKANLIAAIEQGKTVTSVVDVKAVKESDLDQNTVKKIKDTVKNGQIVSFLDINFLLKADSSLLGKITNLGKSIELTVDVDKQLGNVPNNKNRTYFVVRMHEGEESEILKAEYKDGKITFATDKFSDYAVGYTDQDATNPKTVDNTIAYVVVFAVSSLSLVTILRKRHA